MPTSFIEGKHAAAGVLGEAEAGRSRDEITIASGSGILQPMTVIGKFTSGGSIGKWGPSPATGATGNQVGGGVLLYGVDATAADVKVAALTRDCSVAGPVLTYDATITAGALTIAKNDQLALQGIIVR